MVVCLSMGSGCRINVMRPKKITGKNVEDTGKTFEILPQSECDNPG